MATKKMAIIATKGALDMAYPPLILASTASALGWEVLRSLCQEADVKFIACQMTVDLFEFDKSDFIDGIEYGGAAMFMKFAGETDVCLFI